MLKPYSMQKNLFELFALTGGVAEFPLPNFLYKRLKRFLHKTFSIKASDFYGSSMLFQEIQSLRSQIKICEGFTVRLIDHS